MSSNGGPPNPREQKARAEHALKQHQGQQRAFARDLAEGRTGLVDRIGQAVEIGALVLWKVPPAFDLVWTVDDITPSLDPRHPVGTLMVKLSCVVPLTSPAGVRQMTMVRLGHKGDDAPGGGVEAPRVEPASAEEQADGPKPIDVEGDGSDRIGPADDEPDKPTEH